ncbi:AsmA family protein [Sphingobium sp. SCG-1]|uniref:AsmA family protein n=1 Tax=Sphingobium sp. SCG-1 TaxID=2072936 RepID=UPI000CD69A85|nr:AsmA family protein [Sphingobium sp. SCG-1]AUW56817.1 AsmA family protein [Sphingobium sp. SCG-1]
MADPVISSPPATPPQRSGMRPHLHAAQERWRRLPLAARIILWIVFAIFLIWLILFVTKGRFLKSPFQRIVSSSLQRDVRVNGDFQLYFAPIRIKFLADGFSISNPKWASQPYLFRADRIDARISPFSLIFGDKRRITQLLLQKGAADLEWSRDGKTNTWTMGDPNKKGEPLEMPVVQRALIAGTTLRYRDPRLFLSADLAFDTVRAQNTQFAHDIRFRGNGTMRDIPFTVRGGLLAPNETITGGRNQLVAEAVSGGTRVNVAGTLPGATVLEGSDLKVVATGPNMSLLFDFLGAALPDTRRYRFTSDLTKAGEEWRFTRLKGRFGDSDLAGKMTVSQLGGRLLIKADLATDTLDMIDVGPFIGYDPVQLDAKGSAAVVKTVAGRPRLLPDAPLRIEAIRRFDAIVNYKVRTVRGRNIPLSNIGVALKLDKSLMTLSPLTFDMAGGFVSSDISINARGAPVKTTYDIRLSPTPMGKLLGSWGVEEAGTSGTIKARVLLTGLGDSVHESLASSNGRIAIILPAGSMWARNVQLSEIDIGTFAQKMFEDKLKEPVQINCGLLAFSVRGGVAAADPILIDTRKNVMVGRGGFSFRNESLDLAFRADSKKFSLFAGQSPVGIGGYFAKPSIAAISPELLGRAGAGLGLSLVGTPLAGLLAFVDVGDAKGAACGPVLAGAQATAQRTTKGEPRDDVGQGTTAKSESGKTDRNERKSQRKKFLGIF